MQNTQLKPKKNQKSKINYGASIVPNSWLYSGMIVILGCLGFYGYRYRQLQAWTQKQDIQQDLVQPQSIENINSNLVTKEKLSPEDLSVAADLDNIDVLLKEMEQNADRENFVPVQNIYQNKNSKSKKNNNKIDPDYRSISLDSDTKNTTNIPSLQETIDNSSLGKLVKPLAINSPSLLLSNIENTVIADDNLSNSHSVSTNGNSNSIDRLDNQERDLNPQTSITTNPEQPNTINPDYNQNFNLVRNQNSLRSPLGSNQGFINTPGQINRGIAVNKYGTSNNLNSTLLPTGNLSDYQIKLQDYNPLLPRDYLVQPRIESQLNQVQNNGQPIVERAEIPLGNLSNYQLRPQELNPFNASIPYLNTPNIANISQPDSFSTNNNRVDSNNFSNSGLQPSGSLIIDN